jgi:anti-sigma factor RsiW
MKCPLQFEESSELIVGYGARTLDPDTAIAFERHVGCCEACREAAALQRAVWTALDEWHALPVSTDFDQRLSARIADTKTRARWRWRLLLPISACVALCAVLLVRQPAAAPPPPIQQVQHALDDMDLLNQIGASI